MWECCVSQSRRQNFCRFNFFLKQLDLSSVWRLTKIARSSCNRSNTTKSMKRRPRNQCENTTLRWFGSSISYKPIVVCYCDTFSCRFITKVMSLSGMLREIEILWVTETLESEKKSFSGVIVLPREVPDQVTDHSIMSPWPYICTKVPQLSLSWKTHTMTHTIDRFMDKK